MSQLIVPATEYRQLFLDGHPIMDVRAPIEFNKGAFPSACNHPLMVDSERQKVGTCYKQHGQDAAIKLGHALVTGQIKQQRVDAWLAYFEANPNAYLYCFRGGLRSQLTQQWLKDAGLNIPFIQGGYKAMRQYLIDTIDMAANQRSMLVLSGITGSGKTEFIQQRNEAVDLEGIANHRGSSFGRHIAPQPSQINFENQLAIALLQHQARTKNHLLLEDESYLIGRSAIPKSFYLPMQQASIVVLKTNLSERLSRLLDEYVHKMHAEFVSRLGDEAGFTAFSDYLLDSLKGIDKRLGGKMHNELQVLIKDALKQQQSQNDTSAHLEWIAILLARYYDPMYQYQLTHKADRILFEGDHADMHQWLDQHSHP